MSMPDSHDIAILLGSKNDLRYFEKAKPLLDRFQADYELKILSAHRTPRQTADYVLAATKAGTKVFICAAGGAAHLAGAVAGHTPRPVIGVPLDTSPLGGLDALFATVQMPPGMPVATMAVGAWGMRNAVIFAMQILGVADEDAAAKVARFRAEQTADVLDAGTS